MDKSSDQLRRRGLGRKIRKRTGPRSWEDLIGAPGQIEKLIAEYSAVDVLLETLRQYDEMIWNETAREYGTEICGRFKEEDWLSLKNALPSMPLSDKVKLVISLPRCDERHAAMILQELIPIEDPGLFEHIIACVEMREYDLSAESAARLIEKALRYLSGGPFFYLMPCLKICEMYGSRVPDALRRRIPARHVKRFSTDLLPGGNTEVTVDVSDAGLDHAAKVVEVDMLRPWMHYGISYSCKCRSASAKAVVLSIYSDNAYAEFELTYI